MFKTKLREKYNWINGKDNSDNIIISSRVRFARNFCEFAFPYYANEKERKAVFDKVCKLCGSIAELKNMQCFQIRDIEDLEKRLLLEKHLISQDHIVADASRAVILSESQEISIMVNEEDHLRMQVIVGGFNPEDAWKLLNMIDDQFSKMCTFAFRQDIGYLTSCPTNLGTGLRASCMMHLPALAITKRINKVLELLSKLSFATRGFFGEGTQAMGNFFQISNHVSLGVCEEEIINNLCAGVKQVKEHELSARRILMRRYKINVEDKIWRSYAAASQARIMSSQEALSHLSMICLGIDIGVISHLNRKDINKLFLEIQPAHLQRREGKILNEKERDFIRASMLREELQKGKQEGEKDV